MSSTSDTPVLDLLATMTSESLAASTLEGRDLMLVRIAALVAVDAPPSSYLLHAGAASDAGIDHEQARGILAAIAPIVGSARIAAATGSRVRALGIALEVAEAEKDG